jgi:hypothetical protein
LTQHGRTMEWMGSVRAAAAASQNKRDRG